MVARLRLGEGVDAGFRVKLPVEVGVEPAALVLGFEPRGYALGGVVVDVGEVEVPAAGECDWPKLGSGGDRRVAAAAATGLARFARVEGKWPYIYCFFFFLLRVVPTGRVRLDQ
jgi:hypothetical protein